MHGVSHRCLLAAPDVWIMFHPHTYIYNSQFTDHSPFFSLSADLAHPTSRP